MALTSPAEGCPECDGSWLSGKIAIPIAGGLRFVYRLRTNEVATEVTARMCGDCGRVELRGKDPGLIRRAHEAGQRASAMPR
jgi:hypothetical protein